jgi:vacuolar-type H+-ATPase subunit B/Vma2
VELDLSQAIIAMSLAFAAVVTFIVEKLRRDHKHLRKENREDHDKVILQLSDIYEEVKETRSDVKFVNKDLSYVRKRLDNHIEEHKEKDA